MHERRARLQLVCVRLGRRVGLPARISNGRPLSGSIGLVPAAPDEIAAAAVYLASDHADSVHGTAFTVNGGRLAA
jgi:NAD(P)-dependent dehydrogenase (short-subunit alcohol dehydrogenase family)